MESDLQIVISASRRTDIPALYMNWFMEQIAKGEFEVINPYNRQVSIVPATPDNVHTIVFWSKNFGPFIDMGYGEILLEMGYHLFFNFTINSESPVLEPNLPPLSMRMDQLKYLSNHFHIESINWRFDPICFFKLSSDSPCVQNNLDDFPAIAQHAARYGIKRCITSFMDIYPKIQKRTVKMPGFSFIDPPVEEKKDILIRMHTHLEKGNISLHTCCEKDLLEMLPSNLSIANSSCIPNDLLMRIFGGKLSTKKDAGQRLDKGCGCKASVDIGSYHLHPCYHNCLFCYANPSPGKPAQ